MNLKILIAAWVLLATGFCQASIAIPQDQNDEKTVRVFIFAGQSNMVGSDSKVGDIQRFPPFSGLENPQSNVKFSYCIGRESKLKSDGWVDLQAVNKVVGPELSFAKKVSDAVKSPIAIIKCAAGGTHLGGDWNPDEPSGFKMYPLALDWIRKSLAELDAKKIPYRIEGFMWHQGENDMFDPDYMKNYGENLKNFLSKWRADLKTPELKFYIGELCTKTIWGMDLRPRMYAISQGQKSVTDVDPLAEYIPTSHVGVEIGGGAGLHYHYGTLGQLEHGINYADAYLKTIGLQSKRQPALEPWPYKKKSTIKLFVLAGHRNMEGERAFVQELNQNAEHRELKKRNNQIAFKYSIGGGYQSSDSWEALGPSGFYDTFGPELSFGKTLQDASIDHFAICKFTHSGSQIIDWTPEGSVAKTRNLYASFIEFVKQSVGELEAKGHQVELAGIFYHVGENDMSFHPFRKLAAKQVNDLVNASRIDLGQPKLRWFVSQQPPTDHESVNSIDVTAMLAEIIAADDCVFHVKAFDLPRQDKQLVLNTVGIVELGKLLARSYVDQAK